MFPVNTQTEPLKVKFRLEIQPLIIYRFPEIKYSLIINYAPCPLNTTTFYIPAIDYTLSSIAYKVFSVV